MMETSSKEAGEPVDMILDRSAAHVLYDGMLTDPQLDHPEGVAVHRDGSVGAAASAGRYTGSQPTAVRWRRSLPLVVTAWEWPSIKRTTSMSVTSSTRR